MEKQTLNIDDDDDDLPGFPHGTGIPVRTGKVLEF